MNSISKRNCDKNATIQEQNHDCDNLCKHPKPGKALLRCNNGNFGSTVILLLTPPFIQTFNQPIASVTIDTTCLCRKKILADFAGTITASRIAANFFSTFIFTLFKTCKESKFRQAVATFNFSFISISGMSEDRALKFEYSSCDDQCEDCCTYTLELTSISSSILSPLGGEVSISGTLCILAVES